jgi:DNA-directed RNA polymerase subunit RPC12/RpoP
MTKRYLNLKDLFVIRCKSCGSTDIDLSVDACYECGNGINAECNKCGKEFLGHDFKKIEIKEDIL